MRCIYVMLVLVFEGGIYSILRGETTGDFLEGF